jgi:hypothetical protein
MAVGGDDCYLIRIIDCEVGVYKYKEVCNSFGERKSRCEESPGMRVCVEDDDKERG